MTETITREEQIRSALRRLNPEFHEHDVSWGALESLIEERDKLRILLDDTMYSLLNENELTRERMARTVEERLATI